VVSLSTFELTEERYNQIQSQFQDVIKINNVLKKKIILFKSEFINKLEKTKALYEDLMQLNEAKQDRLDKHQEDIDRINLVIGQHIAEEGIHVTRKSS